MFLNVPHVPNNAPNTLQHVSTRWALPDSVWPPPQPPWTSEVKLSVRLPQLLLSPSLLLALQQREAPLPADVQSHENLLELQALRVAMLLLSTCHLVICVHDMQLVRAQNSRTST